MTDRQEGEVVEKAGPDLTELGLPGLKSSYGYITEEEFVPDLFGRKAIETYKKMRDNDPIIGAMLYAFEMLLRSVNWRVQPYSNMDNHLADAEFLESCMNDMAVSWPDTISEISSMLAFGWSFHEIVYKIRRGYNVDKVSSSKFTDGRIGWAKLPIRSQDSLDRWVFGENGKVEGMVQRPAPIYTEIYIPIRKGLLFRTKLYKDNPEGRSVLRNAYRPWYFKQRIEEIEGVGIERDLAGLPMAEVDPEILSDQATPSQKALLARIQEIVQNVRRDAQEGIVWPSAYDENGNQLYKFQLLSAGGSRQFDTSGIIERYVQHMAMTVLADFILLGHESVGSFALSSDKTNLFAVSLGTLIESIAEVFNTDAIPKLFALNGMDTEELPRIVHDDIENPNLAELSAFLGALIGAGMPLFPDEKLEKWVRTVSGMPDKDPNAEPVLPGQGDMAQQDQTEHGGVFDGGDFGEPGVPRTPEPNRPPDTTRRTLGKSYPLAEDDVEKGIVHVPPHRRHGKHVEGYSYVRGDVGNAVGAAQAAVTNRSAKVMSSDRPARSELVAPDGVKMGTSEAGTTFEIMFERKAAKQIGRMLGVRGFRQVTSGGDGNTTAIDVVFGNVNKPGAHYSGELKSRNAYSSDSKVSISKKAKERKLRKVAEKGSIPITVLQVIDQINNQVHVHVITGEFKSFRVRSRKPDFTYRYTDKEFADAWDAAGYQAAE